MEIKIYEGESESVCMGCGKDGAKMLMSGGFPLCRDCIKKVLDTFVEEKERENKYERYLV